MLAQRLLCSHCSGVERGEELKETFFQLSEKRQHFLSQNNLSLCLTRLSAIFTQLKLQMIYFQLHFSPALLHMVLSVKLVTTELDPQTSEILCQTEKATAKYWKKENRRESQRGAKKPHSYCLCWLAFVVRASADTQQREWNYWAFIKQTAGPLWNLKAAAKQPTHKISWQTIAVFLYERHCYRDVLGCYATAKNKTNWSVCQKKTQNSALLCLSDLHFVSHQGMDVTFEGLAALGFRLKDATHLSNILDTDSLFNANVQKRQ